MTHWQIRFQAEPLLTGLSGWSGWVREHDNSIERFTSPEEAQRVAEGLKQRDDHFVYTYEVRKVW